MKNLDIPSPPTYTEIFPDVDSENENGGMNSMSLKSELKGKTIIEFPTIYVLLRPRSKMNESEIDDSNEFLEREIRSIRKGYKLRIEEA